MKPAFSDAPLELKLGPKLLDYFEGLEAYITAASLKRQWGIFFVVAWYRLGMGLTSRILHKQADHLSVSLPISMTLEATKTFRSPWPQIQYRLLPTGETATRSVIPIIKLFTRSFFKAFI